MNIPNTIGRTGKGKQRGVATLLVSVVLLLATTLVILYSSKVTVTEQRISANDQRAKKAFAKGEERLSFGSANLVANPAAINGWPWLNCNSVADNTKIPCGDGTNTLYGTGGLLGYSGADWFAYTSNAGTAFEIHYLTETPLAQYLPVTIVAEGRSDDLTAQAAVQKTISKFTMLNKGPLPPIMVPTTTIGGNMTIVGNPNVTGNNGVPIAIWSANPLAFGGASSMQTCNLGDYRDNANTRCIGPTIPDELGNLPTWNQCNCQTIISDKNNANYDVVVNDPNAPGTPSEVLNHVFGTNDWSAVKSGFNVISTGPDASNLCLQNPKLGSNTNGFVWIQGDCKIGAAILSDDNLGSRDDPVVLVVEGDLEITANNIHIWGIAYITDHAGAVNTDSDVKLTGGPVLHGALVAEKQLDLGAGSYTVLFDTQVFNQLTNNLARDRFGNVAGSWNDRF